MATSLSNETQTTKHQTPKKTMMDASVGYSPPSSKSNSIINRFNVSSPATKITTFEDDDEASYYNPNQIGGKGVPTISRTANLKNGEGRHQARDYGSSSLSLNTQGVISNSSKFKQQNTVDGDNRMKAAAANTVANEWVDEQNSSKTVKNQQKQSTLVNVTNDIAQNTIKKNNKGETNGSPKKVQGSNKDVRNDSGQRNSSSPYRSSNSLSNSGVGLLGPSSMIQSAGLAYPFLYPNTSHLAATAGFPASPAATSYYGGVYSSSGAQSQGGMTTAGSSQSANSASSNNTPAATSSTIQNGTNSRRGGKKKAPLAALTQNPEFRLFFNIKRRDHVVQSNKSSQAHHHHHVYKPKNPFTLQEWFKKLTVEERVNSLSTVCPHLTDTLVNMIQRMDNSAYGQSSCFAQKGTHGSDLKYFGGAGSSSSSYPSHNFGNAYSGSTYSSYFQENQYSSGTSQRENPMFDNLFYHRQSSSEFEQRLRNSSMNSTERVKNEAEQEIIKHVRLTDYNQQLDTLTVNEDLVIDPDYFFKLMSLATANQAFTTVCQFELRVPQFYGQPGGSSGHPSSYQNQYMQYGQPSPAQAQIVVDQPAWFKPKSFHSFATWVIVALEENLWAHYNYETGQNLSSAIKSNELSPLFRERNDSGALDLEIGQLAAYWRDRSEKDRKSIIENLRQKVIKDVEESLSSQDNQSGGSIASQVFKSKVVQSKSMTYSVSIKEKGQNNSNNALKDHANIELRAIVDVAMRIGNEFEMISSLIYTSLDRFQLQIQPIQRKLLDLIKKKYKDDLMENLLQEEYCGSANQKTTSNNSNSQAQNQSTSNLVQSKNIKKKKKKQKAGKQATEAILLTTQAQANTSSSSADQSFVQDNSVTKEAVPQDSHMNPESKAAEEVSIREYVIELTNYLVTEVCRRVTSDTSLQVYVEDPDVREFSDEQKNESNAQALKLKVSKRKNFANNLKFSKQLQVEEKSDQPTIHESQLITQHVKVEAAASNNETQPTTTSTKKKTQNQQPSKKNNEDTNKKQQQSNAAASTATKSQTQAPQPKAAQQQQASQPDEESTFIKKKRNKKKTKLTDIDIMNNFMKSLHQHPDEELPLKKPVVTPNQENGKKKQQAAPISQVEEELKGPGPTNKKGKQPINGTLQPNGTARKYVEDYAPSTVSEDLNKKQQKRQGANGQFKKRNEGNTGEKPAVVVLSAQQNEEVKDVIWNIVEAVSTQDRKFFVEESKDLNTLGDIAEKTLNMEGGHTPSKKEESHREGKEEDAKTINFYPTFQQFIPSSLSTTNSQGDQHSNENFQVVQEASSLTDGEVKKANAKHHSHDRGQSGINYRTPPQSTKKQDANQLSQQNNDVHHFTSGEGLKNLQSFSVHSGSTLSNNLKKLHSNSGYDTTQAHLPSSDVPTGLYSNFGGVSKNQYYGNFQSFGNKNNNGGSNHGSQGDFTYALPQQYPPVPLTPPVPQHLLSSQSLSQPSVFYPQSSRSPNLQTSQLQTFKPIGGNYSSQQYDYTANQQPQLTHSQSHYGYNQKPQRQYNGKGGQYQRPHAQRGVPGRNNNNGGQVQMQMMNLSQSMQEQIQASQHQQNPYHYQAFSPNMMDNQATIFYQDQSMIIDPDTYNLQKQMLDQQQIFPYLMEKSNSVNGQSIPSYSPSQQQMFQKQQHMPNEVQSNQYGNSQNLGSGLGTNFSGGYKNSNLTPQSSHNQLLQQPFYDQNQDLIFQIVNSIKSNHSMSPVPQLIMSPPLNSHDQMSHNSSEHQISEHPEAYPVFYEAFDSEISAFLSQVQANLDLLKPERDFIISKLQDLAVRSFDKELPKIEIFGSLITGLALESSDMDLAVTGLRIDDRMMMIDDLQILATGIQTEWNCINEFKAIETASIPVIKLKVDLIKMREQEMKEREPHDFANRPIPDNQRYLSVDITFDDTGSSSSVINQYSSAYVIEQDLTHTTQTHLGLASCRLVQWYLKNYRNLRQVSILMKKFLAINNFNSPYYGGLSSYSTVILIVAFMNFYGLRDGLGGAYLNRQENIYITQEEMTPAKLLMCFLDFYSNFFNPNLFGISIFGNGSFFQLSSGSNTSVVGQMSLPHQLFMQSQQHPQVQQPMDLFLMSPGGLASMATGGFGASTTNSTSNLMILDPLNNINNTTKNSFLTKDILKQFHIAFSSLKSLAIKQPIVSSQISTAVSPLALFLIKEQPFVLSEESSQFTLPVNSLDVHSTSNPQISPSSLHKHQTPYHNTNEAQEYQFIDEIQNS